MEEEILRIEKDDDFVFLIDKINELQADKNKLINYIAVRENKTYEEVCKEFELGE